MTATLLWDVTRRPVGPAYLGRPVSGDAIGQGPRPEGQLWERLLAAEVELVTANNGTVLAAVVAKEPDDDPWEYGFYDSNPNNVGGLGYEDAPQPNPTIYWYVFGFLPHETAESAEHTGRKSTWGHPVIVRRRRSQADIANAGGSYQWEHVEE